jgi:hypothetical protein
VNHSFATHAAVSLEAWYESRVWILSLTVILLLLLMVGLFSDFSSSSSSSSSSSNVYNNIGGF